MSYERLTKIVANKRNEDENVRWEEPEKTIIMNKGVEDRKDTKF